MTMYTDEARLIKTKKCVKCNRSFQFKKSTKFSKNCYTAEAVAIIKELKIKRENEKLTKFINSNTNSLN